KWGRFGKFLACSGYPDCKYTKDLGGREKPADEMTDEMCPTCGKPMVIKHGRFGKFIACSGYPECKTTKPVTLGIACPEPGCVGSVGRPAGGGERPARQDFLRVHPVSRLQVRGVGAPGGRAVPEVQRAFPDRAGGEGRQADAPVRARRVRLPGRGRSLRRVSAVL